ncbi:uncharacterized protein LOC141693693 [Apium graveolens]|uniref:uncharacterized protein LOC141693693 n=1 Tax=Apium graveolens TaxID=4045 RepID=UPI003D792F4C
MATSLVSTTLASTNVNLVPRSRIVYVNSTCHQPIGLHGSVISGKRCSYRRDFNRLPKVIAKSRRNVVVHSSIVPPEVDIPSLPASIGVPDQWQAWLMGAVVTVGLPFLTNKWGPLLGWMEKLKGTLQTAENITEAVEDMAGKVDKMVEEMEASLPEGKLKNALHNVELAAEEIARDADRLDQLIDKVQEMEEKFEDLIEEGNEVAKEIKSSKTDLKN